MSPNALRRNRASVIVLLVSLAVFAYAARELAGFIPDDSYISFRYAENLSRGHGITFNPGEPPVEGYSNFLWILVCALSDKLGMELPHIVPRIGALVGKGIHGVRKDGIGKTVQRGIAWAQRRT